MASADVVNLILHHARKGSMLVNNIAAVKGCGGFKETRMYAPGTLCRCEPSCFWATLLLRYFSLVLTLGMVSIDGDHQPLCASAGNAT